MSSHRRGTFGTALTVALTLLAGGCAGVKQPAPAMLTIGYDTLDGSLQVWPARGGQAQDQSKRRAVTEEVERWRTPTGDRAHLASSGILWLGEVDGVSLALVAAIVPGGRASWLLQLSGQGDGFKIDHAAEYTDPGYLVYSDVLPVNLPTGRRYLTSARVQRLLGPAGAELRIEDGLSVPVDVPGCAAVTLTADLRPTESLPTGRTADRLVDLGTTTEDPRYPLVRDSAASAAKALDGLDTCSLADKTGPFGSIPQRNASGKVIDTVPISWPIDRISARSLGEFAVGQGPPGRFSQLEWRTDAGGMSAIVYRPRTGSPVVSRADRTNALQTYLLQVSGRTLVVLVWKPDTDITLSLPAGMSRLVDQPGLVVLLKSPRKQTYSLHSPQKTYYRSVADRDVEPAPDSD